MQSNKTLLSIDELDELSAVELPDRELMQCNALVGCITISNVLNHNTVTITVPVNVSNVCISVLGNCTVAAP